MATVDPVEIEVLIRTLGFQNQRTHKLIAMAKKWFEDPPAKGRRHRTLYYPALDDGKDLPPNEIVNDDHPTAGAFEVAHLPGVSDYALDSWRILCQDKFRGLADNWKGDSALEGFVPEWKRVRPIDKELKAYLRWMWLREEAVHWDPSTGRRYQADEKVIEAGRKGCIEWDDFEFDLDYELDGSVD